MVPTLKDRLQRQANEMGDFVVKNIHGIHSRLDVITEELPSCDLVSPTTTSEFVATKFFATYRKQFM